jgi:diaminohydroxyphosphoribosylaminopyrimidine deaminase/5-amino-6-(5-phosphoribosylamino)uracil reductase
MRAISSLPGAQAFENFGDATPEAPFVVAQLGQSLDGRICHGDGGTPSISTAQARSTTCMPFARIVDAVVVGIGTVIADDPQLNVRRVAGRDPARVVIDPQWPPAPHRPGFCAMTAPGASSCAGRAGVNRFPGASKRSFRARWNAGPRRPAADSGIAEAGGFRRILLEGGARTISDFLAAGCIDRLHMLVAPMLIGSGKPGIALPPIETLDDALRPETSAYLLEGGDVLFDCDLRRSRAAIEA